MGREWSWYIGQNRRTTPAPVLEGIDGGGAAAPEEERENDEWWERVVKAIPTEVVGVYTIAILTAQAGLDGTAEAVTLGIVLAVGLVFTYLAMRVLRGLNPSHGDPELARAARVQIIVAILAFLVWAYSQGGSFNTVVTIGSTSVPLHNDTIATLLVLGVGFLTLISDKIAGVGAPAPAAG
jgi:hypothetical protein